MIVFIALATILLLVLAVWAPGLGLILMFIVGGCVLWAEFSPDTFLPFKLWVLEQWTKGWAKVTRR
jgi:hypothetical protein